MEIKEDDDIEGGCVDDTGLDDEDGDNEGLDAEEDEEERSQGSRVDE